MSKNVVLLGLILLTEAFGIQLRLKPLKDEALDHFESIEKLQAGSIVQCGGYLSTKVYDAEEDKNFSAFKFKDGICELGSITGTMPGDFEVEPRGISGTDVYISSCLPKTKLLGKDLLLFYSFMDDNVDRVAIVQENGNFRRTSATSWKGPTEYHNSWPNFMLFMVREMPFKVHKGASRPAWMKAFANTIIIEFTIEPVTIESFSIFAWGFWNGTDVKRQGLLTFGKNNDDKNQEFYFLTGGESTEFTKLCAKYKAPGGYIGLCANERYTTTSWIYIGMVFDSKKATVQFYENGQEISHHALEAAFIGFKFEDIKFVKIGAHPYAYGADVGASFPMAAVEIHTNAKSKSEVRSHYELSLSYLDEQC